MVADYGKQPQSSDPVENNIAKEVRHELLMLPYYSLFDDLEYTVQGRTVILSGSLTSEHAETKSDAAAVVKRIEGVDKVINNIKILPPAPIDQQARVQLYRRHGKHGRFVSVFLGGGSQYPHYCRQSACNAEGIRQR